MSGPWEDLGIISGLLGGAVGEPFKPHDNPQKPMRQTYPRQRPGDLSDSQIDWLRKNIPSFNIAKEAADKVRAEVEANRKAMSA